MDAKDYGVSLSIDPALLEPTPAERDRQAQMYSAAVQMGYDVRLSMRKMARECGMTILPGATIYVGTRGYAEPVHLPPEDLTVLLPEEVDCAGVCK